MAKETGVSVAWDAAALNALFMKAGKEPRRVLLALAVARHIFGRPFPTKVRDHIKDTLVCADVKTFSDMLTADEIAETTKLDISTVRKCLQKMLDSGRYPIYAATTKRKHGAMQGYGLLDDEAKTVSGSIAKAAKEAARNKEICNIYAYKLLGILGEPSLPMYFSSLILDDE